MKNTLLTLFLCGLLSACTMPAYIVREYSYLPAGLNKKAFRKVVAEKNAEIRAEDGYMKLYDLVHLDQDLRRKLYLEERFFANLYVKAQDSSLLKSNLIRLSSIKDRMWVYPSVYVEMNPKRINPNYWTAFMDEGKQQAIRDTIDMATTPILKVSKYKLDPTYFYLYLTSMDINKANLKKAKRLNRKKKNL